MKFWEVKQASERILSSNLEIVKTNIKKKNLKKKKTLRKTPE